MTVTDKRAHAVRRRAFALSLRRRAEAVALDSRVLAWLFDEDEATTTAWLRGEAVPNRSVVLELEELLRLKPGELCDLLGLSLGPEDVRVLVPRLLNVDEAAAVLATTEGHVRKLVLERRIGYVKLGSKLRFRLEDLDRFIELNRHASEL